MKTLAIFVTYLLVKSGISVSQQMVGGFDVWLLIVYAFVGLIIIKSSLRLEIKVVYWVLALVDGLLPLTGYIWFRWFEVLLTAGWLVSYLWRVVHRDPSVATPWKSEKNL